MAFMASLRKLWALAVPLLFIPAFLSTPTTATHVRTDDFVTLEAQPSASIVQVGPSYKSTRMFLSEVYEAKSPFQLIGLDWQQALPQGTAATLEIHFRDPDGNWSDWQPVEPNDDDAPDNATTTVTQGYDQSLWSYVITETADAFQYRAHLSTQNSTITPKLSDISFDTVSGGKTSMVNELTKLIFDADTSVVSRTEWGADESLRLAKTYNVDDTSDFESELGDSTAADDPDMTIVKRVNTDANGNALLWPLEYPATIKKIIVHHTATTENLDDPEAAIRAIYYYHAVTRGWGDIGYNYIVAPDGEVFEGRAGGDGVVAGHAQGYNTGSVGIALLGNYEENPLPGQLVKSLEGLIYQKAGYWKIDPDGSGEFRGEMLDNVIGHRDVGSTACPGDYTYEQLQDIREMVGLALDNSRTTDSGKEYSYEESTDRELVTLDPNDSETVTVKIKNTGTKTWDKNTFITVNANSEADELISIPKDSQKRTALMKETSVKPGSSATFSFKVESNMNGGLASFDMAPVFNGTKKTTHTMDLGFYVELPTLDFSVSSSDAPSSLKPGESKTVTIKLKNTGNLTWEKSGDYAVKLVKSGTSSLTNATTLASLKETSVKPGSSGTFEFTIKAPTTGGTYTLYFSPSMSNSNAVVTGSGQISVKVSETTEDAMITNKSTDWDFAPGETKSVWLQIKNTGSSKWSSTGSKAFKLVFTKPTGFTISTPKIGFQTLSSGTSSKLYFNVTAPTTAGTYEIGVRPRLGSSNLTTSAYTIKVTVGSTGSQEQVSYEDPIRIKLTPDNGVGTPILTSTSNFAAYDDTKLLKVFSANSRVRVTDTDGSFKLTSGSGEWTASTNVRFQAEDEGIMTISTMSQPSSWDNTQNDNSFRGTIEVTDIDGEAILINELEIEDYLKGIGEEPNSAPTEKIKTILVLARTYATYYSSAGNVKFAGMPYDLEDDPATSQKYLGYGFESRAPNVVKAVEDTAGKVVTYKGKVVITPYFSQSDGKATKSAQAVWGWTNTPWLVSVPDTQCTDTDGTFAGHGVGLSGCGAEALAEQGKTFEQIIKTYYTGVEITKL